jgi:formate dehydrogenase iron-sulfur subunit
MATGFFTDTTVCIGCKACEVACKQWNQLPDDGFAFSGLSYDNTVQLGASTWRHVAFVEQPDRWLMLSDVCKHCARTGCLEACPTGAIIRTEFDSVYVQPDVCNGCGYCVVSCPFGVIDRLQSDGRAWKCTLCYDRQRGGLEPACAKACPTDSIQFGELSELRAKADQRVAELHARGVTEAYLYGADPESQPGTEGLHAFFLLVDRPETYNLPPQPVCPTKTVREGWASLALAGLGILAAAIGAVASSRS